MNELVAHGIGGRQDLPIPLELAVAGAAAALVYSFVVLALAWRDSRFDGDAGGLALPPWVTSAVDSPALQWILRVVGLLLVGYTAMVAYVAPDFATNPAAGLVYVVFWLGLIPASLLLGPVWTALNPVRTIHLLLARATGAAPESAGLRSLPAWLGYWPAAAGLLAFAWLELVAPNQATTPVIRAFFTAYLGVHLVGVVVFGSRWLDRGDAFEVFSRLLGRLSPLGRRTDGRIVVRNPLANLDGTSAGPGLAAVVCVLLGSTAYDSLTGSPRFVRWYQASPLGATAAGTLGLLTAVALILAAYALATGLAGRATGLQWRSMPGAFAHALVPIALGYLVAHYLTLFVLEGQRTMIAVSDPFSDGSDWFGTAGYGVDQSVANHPTLIASIQVGAIVLGHVLGAISAHDRSVRLFPRDRVVAGQLPLMALMVAYTVTGLLLLFAA